MYREIEALLRNAKGDRGPPGPPGPPGGAHYRKHRPRKGGEGVVIKENVVFLRNNNNMQDCSPPVVNDVSELKDNSGGGSGGFGLGSIVFVQSMDALVVRHRKTWNRIEVNQLILQ